MNRYVLHRISVPVLPEVHIGTAWGLGRGELVKKGEGEVGILDDLEVIGQRVSRQHPLDGGDVCRIIVDGKDGQWGERCQSLHDQGSGVRFRPSHTRPVRETSRRTRRRWLADVAISILTLEYTSFGYGHPFWGSETP